MRFMQTYFGLTNCDHITLIKIEYIGIKMWAIRCILLGKDDEFTVGIFETYDKAKFIHDKILEQLNVIIINTDFQNEEEK